MAKFLHLENIYDILVKLDVSKCERSIEVSASQLENIYVAVLTAEVSHDVISIEDNLVHPANTESKAVSNEVSKLSRPVIVSKFLQSLNHALLLYAVAVLPYIYFGLILLPVVSITSIFFIFSLSEFQGTSTVFESSKLIQLILDELIGSEDNCKKSFTPSPSESDKV